MAFSGIIRIVMICLLPAAVAGKELNRIPVDLSGPGCDSIDGYYVGNEDMVQVSHSPRFNTISTRNDCEVTFRTASGRRLEYSIDSLRFYEGGIEIFIYDDPRGNINERHYLVSGTVGSLPIRGKTPYNVLRIVVRRATYSTTNYELKMRIINDMPLTTSEFPSGKTLDSSDDDYQGEGLDPGVIIGIAIAGVIIIVALILLAIYLCVRSRQNNDKEDYASSARAESNVYTSGNSQVLFATKERNPRGRYGSMEDIHSTASQEKASTNGAYTNPAYTAGPREKKFERQAQVRRAGETAGFENTGYDDDEVGSRATYDSWQEDEVRIGSFRRPWEHDGSSDVKIGSFRRSRRDDFQTGEKKKLKSAMKKPTEIEMSKVNTQPINGILKAPRTRSPNRSQTSSTEGSMDMNALVHGYSHVSSKTEHPNIKHKPVIERRRSRSGTRSNRSTSSTGSHGHRSHSADRKPKPKPNSRMYQDVFISDPRPRSSSRSRARSNSAGRRRDRGSDSVDSESSAASSRRVNMNPGGKRVHIKGEETDI